jgi:hypothetical protein
MKTGISIVLLVLMGGMSVHAVQVDVALTVGDTDKQMVRYGLDYERLWFWYGSGMGEVPKWSVLDCNIDYIRCAINCGYELTETNFNLSAYTDKIIPMMTAMQNANPNIKWFASPRPLNEAVSGANWQPYPTWITGDNGNGSFNFNWTKCAEYLVRYLILMDSYGFEITYLDVTNEWQSYPTGGRLQPSDVLNIRNYLSANLPAHMDMPHIIAPSAWSFTQGSDFVSDAVALGVSDGFDIAASHNTGDQGTAQGFADAATAAGKEIWDSEVHGWIGSLPATEIATSSQMFDRIRAGFTGLNGWLAIGTTTQGHCYFLNNGTTVTRNVKYYIFQKLANISNYGYALDIDQPAEFTSTAALIRENLLAVWVLNTTSSNQLTEFDISNHTMADSTITVTRWNEYLTVEGVSDVITATTNTSFTSAIEGNSLYCFEITLEDVEDNYPFMQAENYTTMSGVSVLPCNDTGGGDMVAFSDVNDEIFFDLDITRTFMHDITFRVSSESSNVKFDIYNGSNLVASVDRVPTGDAQNWTTIYKTLPLDGGPAALKIRAAGGGWNMNWIRFDEGFWSTETLENLAMNQAASASSVHSARYEADNAVDGNRDTHWAASTSPAWLEVDFGTPTAINGVSFYEYVNQTTAYEIRYSDAGITWYTAYTGGNPEDDVVYNFPTVTGTKFRYQSISSTGSPTIYEFELFFDPYYTDTDPSVSMDIGLNSASLSWSGVPGSTYAFQRTTNLVTDTFTSLETGIPAQDPANTNTLAIPDDAAFYRIILE